MASSKDAGAEPQHPAPSVQHPAWLETATVAVELDVRPFHQRGEEPFGAIMAAAAQVPAGQVLRLRNSFEPVPLYTVLGQRGFDSWARQLEPGDWEVFFLRRGERAGPHPPPLPEGEGVLSPLLAGEGVRPPLLLGEGGGEGRRQTTVLDWSSASATVTIDVSDLVPPEPMIKILEAIEALPPGGTLLVHHVRRPIHLYPRLDELGCRHETRELSPGRIEVLIQKAAAAPAPEGRP